MSHFIPLNTFQVHIKLPDVFNSSFIALIPQQRARVNELLEDRTILNYALDIERSNLWITMQAKHQNEVMDVLSTFPIIKNVSVEIYELAFFDSAPTGLPDLIMN